MRQELEKSRQQSDGFLPGITKEEEQAVFQEIIEVADENLNRIKGNVENLATELNELKEVYDVDDKEGLAQWFNTDARFKQVREDLLRAERGRKKPYFGRIDFMDTDLKKKECYYIGRSVIAKDAAHPMVIDWRAPIASVYYERALGKCDYQVKGEGSYEIELFRKRTYEIENDQLVDFYDTDVVANDDLLTKYLARNKRAVLSDIIATIQKEQNEIIRRNPKHNIIVQGAAGSGKTTVAMHRISYILYNYEREFKPRDFYIIGSNRILLNYITGILPDLDVYGISQMTMEQLFVRLLYEDWDEERYTIKKQDKKDQKAALRGTQEWFQDLEQFCDLFEKGYLPRQDIVLDKTQEVLMSHSAIDFQLNRFRKLSLCGKLEKLTERLMSELEKAFSGKAYSYSKEERKKLTKKYENYFMRLAWKGSVFDLYQDFLQKQKEKGYWVEYSGNDLDLYDLAALAYLYKRIKETEVIQEASHVIIDEAQDFGMMVYQSLHYCLSKCTYTIMGDVSQNIYFSYGLTDWEQLRTLMLPNRFDYFGLLKKSYRNTVEISNFATNILRHGSFSVYPVEPIIRHGKEVEVLDCVQEQQLYEETLKQVKKWQQAGYETIAVLCSDEKQAASVSAKLKEHIAVQDFDAQTEHFDKGIMVLSLEYAKGLEFDAVILFQADAKHYPTEDGYVKLLYVAATRALHELAVLYTGKLTELIAKPVVGENVQQKEEENAQQNKEGSQSQETQQDLDILKDTRTKQEVALQQAKEGHWEMEQRARYGPKRIAAQRPKAEIKPAIKAGTASAYQRTFIGSSLKKEVSIQVKTAGKAVARHKEEESDKSVTKEKFPEGEFNTLPENTSLRPIGHPVLNYSIKWLTVEKQYVDFTTACGVLRITPIAKDVVRVSFARTEIGKLSETPAELKRKEDFRWNCKESREKIEIRTDKMIVCVEKRTGAVAFYTEKGKLLLMENERFPRQLGNSAQNQNWIYFDWGKKEILKARGEKEDTWVMLENTAKYISFGRQSKRAACILSNKGYRLMVPAGVKTLCCTIASYGPYLSAGQKNGIDYFFQTGV